MKLYEGGSVVLIIIGVAALIGLASSYMLGDDNPVEQYSEYMIESQTGVKIDLTPEDETGGFIQSVDWEKVQQMDGSKEGK